MGAYVASASPGALGSSAEDIILTIARGGARFTVLGWGVTHDLAPANQVAVVRASLESATAGSTFASTWPIDTNDPIAAGVGFAAQHGGGVGALGSTIFLSHLVNGQGIIRWHPPGRIIATRFTLSVFAGTAGLDANAWIMVGT